MYKKPPINAFMRYLMSLDKSFSDKVEMIEPRFTLVKIVKRAKYTPINIADILIKELSFLLKKEERKVCILMDSLNQVKTVIREASKRIMMHFKPYSSKKRKTLSNF